MTTQIDAKMINGLSSHPPQAIIKAPLGARPAGWSPADCDAPVASMTASGTIVTVQAGLQVAYADSGQVRLSAELAAPLTIDLAAEADGTKHVYVNLAADGTIESAGITSSAPQVGYDRVDARLAPSGVNIGNMTLSGGLAAAFDGNVDQAAAASAAAGSSALGGYAGNDFGSPQALKYAIAYSSNSSGFWNGATTGKVQLWGSNSNDFTTATLISSVSITNTLSQRVVTLNADSSNYRYRWVQALPDNTTLSTYIAEIEWYIESQADIYNAASVTMLDSAESPIRRVYLGSVVKSGGSIVSINCYAMGTKCTLPLALRFSPGVKYTLGNPFPTKHEKAQPLLYNAGKFCKTNPPVYIGGWQGAAYEIDETAITVQVLGSYAYAYNKATSAIDGFSSGKLAIEIERGF